MNTHQTVRQKVKVLVEQFPDLGENYNKLNAAYWSIYDGCEKINDIVNATPAETIRRNFQKLVETRVIPVPKRAKLKFGDKCNGKGKIR
ncbi:hypothetical protein ACSVDA_11845 [Cytobacillus sp. Hm23]